MAGILVTDILEARIFWQENRNANEQISFERQDVVGQSFQGDET